MKTPSFQKTIFLTLTFAIVACENPVKKAARNVEYSAYELVGVEKRDLLKKRVNSARDEEKQASEEFGDALTRLKTIYGFKGGNLEKEYDKLNSAYNRSASQAQDVHQSVDRVETVAKDLFDEWEKEIGEMQTPALKSKSREELQATQNKYAQMINALKASEERMDPVLHQLHDQVLFLKHNLNAQAIGSLKGESSKIQGEIEKLMQDMQKSIASADQFISHL